MDMSGKVVNATLWGEDVSTRIEWSEHVQRGEDVKSFQGGGLARKLWGFGHVGCVDPS